MGTDHVYRFIAVLVNGSVRSDFFATAGNVAPKITPDAGNNQDENETI